MKSRSIGGKRKRFAHWFHNLLLNTYSDLLPKCGSHEPLCKKDADQHANIACQFRCTRIQLSVMIVSCPVDTMNGL